VKFTDVSTLEPEPVSGAEHGACTAACTQISQRGKNTTKGRSTGKKKRREVDGIIQAERTKKAHKKSCRTK